MVDASIPSLHTLSAHLTSFTQYEVEPCRRTGKKVSRLVKKEFPKELGIFLQMIPGNNMCPDCHARGRLGDLLCQENKFLFNGGCQPAGLLPWANVKFGTLICSECAKYHINMNKQTSCIMSLKKSKWNLPQILALFEGGNKSFITVMGNTLMKLLIEQSKQVLSKASKKKSLRSPQSTQADTLLHVSDLFQHIYEQSLQAQKYKDILESRVMHACKIYGGRIFKHCDTSIFYEQDENFGSSMVTFMMQQAAEKNKFSVKKKNQDNETPKNHEETKERVDDKDATENQNVKPPQDDKHKQQRRFVLTRDERLISKTLIQEKKDDTFVERKTFAVSEESIHFLVAHSYYSKIASKFSKNGQCGPSKKLKKRSMELGVDLDFVLKSVSLNDDNFIKELSDIKMME